ncbi:PepSY-associated TM helix domain-containing protein [Pseudohaliea rubra]|nr:PepSY-associated TM helix domain-containing protein [Pseudohaliea rubra]
MKRMVAGPNRGRALDAAALDAHAWLGLMISAAMYLICLSGALAVFNQEFERWEQPAVEEDTRVRPKLAAQGLEHFVERYGRDTSHFHVVFPTSGIPRLVVENDDIAHFVRDDGTLGAIESAPWTRMLIDLHYYLHLPKNFGMILVSVCGALLVALIVSGILAHPRIVRDAFRFRRGGNGTQASIDLHNRLSVWGLPFHLTIAITGAYYGLIGLLVSLAAHAFFDGDTEAVSAPVFAPEPSGYGVEGAALPDIARAVDHVLRVDPEGRPIFLTIHDPGTVDEFVELYVQQPGRLIYSENYRFSPDGERIGRGGYRDGAGGKQFVYSLYRIHFGDFAGVGTKVLYFILGMMLAVVSASGVSIWLGKRKRRTMMDDLWPAFVWGTPIALATSAIATLMGGAGSAGWVFWLVLLVTTSLGARLDAKFVRQRYPLLLGGCLIALVVLYLAHNGSAAMHVASWPVTASLFCFAFALLWPLSYNRLRRPQRKAVDSLARR